MKESGTVKWVGPGLARIEVRRQKACRACGACLATGPDTMEVEVVDNAGHAVGDVVRLEMDDRIALQAVGFLYGLPGLALFSLLVFFIKVLRLPEIPAAVLGILALGPVIWGVSRCIRRFLPERRVKPRIVTADKA